MKRRDFFKHLVLPVTIALQGRVYQKRWGNIALAGTHPLNTLEKANEAAADLIIIGGGTGGCAAALAAARNGRRVIMTEETDWIGGQLSAQAVPPDEHPWIEAFGATRAYRDFRSRVRDYYYRNYPLTAEARTRVGLNPGNGRVSRLCFEPRVAVAVLQEMLAPYVSSGRLTILLEHKPRSTQTQGDWVKAVTVQNLRSGRELTLTAPFIIDATEPGDLLPMTGTEFVTGCESQKETGERHAPAEAQPHNIQSFTCCLAMDYVEGADHSMEKPHEYEFWKAYVPSLMPAWPGPLLSWVTTDPLTMKARRHNFDPVNEDRMGGGLWTYRRIADKRNFVEGTYAGDICLVNWPQNDYWLGHLYGISPEESARHLARAKQLSLSLLYWLQTEAPRPDGKQGWPGLRLRKDVVGTEDGLAKYPYLREARRIRAEFTVFEEHVQTEARMQVTGRPRDEVQAAPFHDSVGVGSYRIDLHPSRGGNNYIDVSALPFQIPLGALIPQRIENLLPGGKNLGVTHITNGCYRLHPVEWNVGEAAGLLAAFCLEKKSTPRAVRRTAKLLEEFQQRIQAQGVEIHWPKLRAR
ncbi:MAG: FAD-dependent oxidoreductase [Acidobacteria bacterium]|nr:FAD-dependent oxidoreductase [Acidobacteriota bacterium]MBI3657331.1 FAD-dependent oxidoreductase [Acidobacteriota bacterium]